MRPVHIALVSFLVAGALCSQMFALPFSMFPKAGHLTSPDGRFEVRDADRQGAANEFVGTFHSLWLTEAATGRSRKLCDYVGLAAVAWSSNNSLVVTQYVGKKTSRTLVFAAAWEEPVLLDTATLIQMVPVELRPTLRENDHTFVEASCLEEEIFFFRVWGYGQHDPDGFRWGCRYSLSTSQLSCKTASKIAVGK
jgi:hypothetical protein